MNKKVLVLINGEAGAGKDTFVDFCRNQTYREATVNIHRSDNAKEILYRMGWDGEKTREVRKLLADLTDFGDSTGYNINIGISTIYSNQKYIFYHSRSTEFIEELKSRYANSSNVLPVSVLIKRDRAGEESKEEDRWGIEDYSYDFVIENNSDFRALKDEAVRFMEILDIMLNTRCTVKDAKEAFDLKGEERW